jgi:hypothetical protein
MQWDVVYLKNKKNKMGYEYHRFLYRRAETISGSIGFALLYLLNNPEIQHRIHTELDGIAIGIGVIDMDRP